MKVYLKKNISAYSGKDGEDDVVYHAHKNGNICIASNYVMPRLMAHHLTFASNGKTIKNIWSLVSTAYKNDMKSYAVVYSRSHPDKTNINGYVIFCKLLYSYAKALGVQVSDLEYDTLKSSAVKSIHFAISEGYLPEYDFSFDLNSNM